MNDFNKFIINKFDFNILEFEYGNYNKKNILKKLSSLDIELNKYAEILIKSQYFKTNGKIQKVKLIEFSLNKLELKELTISNIINKAVSIGLLLCPLEIAPYYRLYKLNQEQENLISKNQAPKGSITIISEIYKENDESFPKGFYIIKKDNKLCLRGYTCSLDYIWKETDKVAFLMPNNSN